MGNGAMFALNTKQPFFDEPAHRYAGLAVYIVLCSIGQMLVGHIIKPVTAATRVVISRHRNIVDSLIHGKDVLEERPAPEVPEPVAYQAQSVLDGPSDFTGPMFIGEG